MIDALATSGELPPDEAVPGFAGMPEDMAAAVLEFRRQFEGARGMGEARPRARRLATERRLATLAGQIREMETEAIRHFRALPHVESFFASDKNVRILCGSNQSSKTFHGLAEIARAVTGQDPYGKYPKENGRAILVGYDMDHLADPIFRKLFVQGEFKLIPDEHTGKFRAVRPDPANPRQLDPYDLAYQEKWIDAPPLIPGRFVREHAWEHANKQIPRMSRLINDWTILWRSSNSRPPRGRQVHVVGLDEDLQKAGEWINELVPRLLKHNGKLIWMATGQEGGPELIELIDKAKEGCPYIDVWNLLIVDNAFISDEQRAFFRETLTNEDEVAVRFHGEIATVRRLVYREYQPNGMHGYEPFPIPPDWCRYVVIDPSRQHTGVLFVAVDPQERHAWVYDGFDVPQANAIHLAGMVMERQGAMKFEAAVMDEHMGRTRHTGGFDDCTVASNYWVAFAEVGVQFRRWGPLSGFFPGSDNIEGRTLALKGWMTPRLSGPFAGTPKLKVARGMIPLLDKQIARAHTESKRGQTRSDKTPQDLLDCLEYGAAFEPGYFAPGPAAERSLGETPKILTPAECFYEKQRRLSLKRAARGESRINLGAAMEIGR